MVFFYELGGEGGAPEREIKTIGIMIMLVALAKNKTRAIIIFVTITIATTCNNNNFREITDLEGVPGVLSSARARPRESCAAHRAAQRAAGRGFRGADNAREQRVERPDLKTYKPAFEKKRETNAAQPLTAPPTRLRTHSCPQSTKKALPGAKKREVRCK